MQKPLISIITSTYNSHKTLKKTMDSVVQQSYFKIQYIIIDGNSTDSTVSIIKLYESVFLESGKEFLWISEPDSGIYNAWNKGLKKATGDWIVFIGSDDYFHSNSVVKTMIPYLKGGLKKNIKYVYGVVEHVNNDDKVIDTSGKPWHFQKETFKQTMNVGHSGSFHHKSLFDEYGLFNDAFKIAGDYEFLLRELKKPDKKALFVDMKVLVMKEGGVSARLQNRLLLIKENKMARKLNGIKTFSWKLFTWEVRVRIILLITLLFGKNLAAKLADIYRKIFLGKEKRWSA